MDTKTMDQIPGFFYNGIWKNPMDQSDHFVPALPSISSSPVALTAATGGDGGAMGQLVPRFNLSMLGSQIRPNFRNNSSLAQFYADPGLEETVKRLSCFTGLNGQLELRPKNTSVASKDENLGSQKKRCELWRSEMAEKEELVDSTEDSNLRKRKLISLRKAKEDLSPSAGEAKDSGENDNPSAKRSKADEAAEKRAEANGRDDEAQKHNKENSKATEPPKDYIHVRARRGQATDSHSLAERVRREKISERMKLLQDLVPGCSKVTGKAVMLDEIINYVQSLQRQVEFLSMKLATVNHRMDLNMDSLLSKDMNQIFHTQGSSSDNSRLLDSLMPMLPFSTCLQQDLSGATNNASVQFLMNQATGGLDRNPSMHLHPVPELSNLNSQVPSVWEDDLQTIVQMGFPQNEPQSFHTMRSTVAGQLKVEL